jgi:hypothetical protein
MAVDISTELEKIENNPNGSVVKDAIYDALLKLANAEGGGGTGYTAGAAWLIKSGFKIVIFGNADFQEVT